MKQDLAMRCNQKQFDLIEPKLKEKGLKLFMINKFHKDYYLVLFHEDMSITNGTISDRINTVFYEKWNEKIFLEACGIEVEKTFSITESQIKDLCHSSLYSNTERLKKMFPEAFESDVKEIQINTWYKSTEFNQMIIFVESQCENGHLFGYGFDKNGQFTIDRNKDNIDWCLCNSTHKKHLIEATEQEVFEALKNEAVKRYKEKMIVPLNIDLLDGYKNNYQELYFEKYCRLDDYNWLWVNFGKWNAVVFDNGKWAEIIPTITLSEAEQQLKKKIIV